MVDSKHADTQSETLTITEFGEQYGKESLEKLIRNIIPKNLNISHRAVVYIEYPKTVKISLNNQQRFLSEKLALDVSMWKFVRDFKLFLPKNIGWNLSHQMPFETSEHPRKQHRWKGCVDEILTAYPLTLMAMYREKYYNPETEKNVERIFDDIKNGFTRIFTKVLKLPILWFTNTNLHDSR